MNDIQNKLNDEYLYFEVSAKNGNNISMAFDKMKKLIMENKIKNEEIDLIKDEDNNKKGKKSKNKNNKEKNQTKKIKINDKNENQKNKKCC